MWPTGSLLLSEECKCHKVSRKLLQGRDAQWYDEEPNRNIVTNFLRLDADVQYKVS